MWAKQSTAATLIVGPILDSSGAEYTSAVIGDLSISKNGGTLTALASAATLTHISNGQYTLVLTTGNTDTLGRAQITCNKSTYQMPEVRLMVVPAMVFDSMILGSDRFDVNVTHVADTAQTARDIGASVLLSNGTGAGQVKLASGYVAMTWADIGSPTTVVNLSGTTVKTATDVESDTSDIQARLPAALVSGRMDSSVGAMAADTLTAAAIAASAVTEIQSGLATSTNVSDAQTAIITQVDANETKIDAIKLRTDNLPSDPADQSLLEAAITASQSAIIAQGNSAWVTATGFSTHSAADVWSVVTRTITGGTITTVGDKTGYSLATAPPTAAAIADAVWDEARAGHTTSGTFGYYVDAQISGISGGGGGGDATLANQVLILDQLDEIQIAVSSVSITTTGFGAVNAEGTLILKRGHTATVTFTSSTNNVVADLSVANTKVFFGIRDSAGRQWLSLEGTVLVATGLQSVTFTIPVSSAAALIVGIHLYDVFAVYGYDSNSMPPYTALAPFASGTVRVQELSFDLDDI